MKLRRPIRDLFGEIRLLPLNLEQIASESSNFSLFALNRSPAGCTKNALLRICDLPRFLRLFSGLVGQSTMQAF